MEDRKPVACKHTLVRNRAKNIGRYIKKNIGAFHEVEESVTSWESEKGMGEVEEFRCKFIMQCVSCESNLKFEFYFSHGDRLKERIV